MAAGLDDCLVGFGRLCLAGCLACRDERRCSVSGGKVRALHGVETIDGVSYAGLQGAGLRGGQEAVAQAGERRVAVDVVEDGVVPCGEERRRAGVGEEERRRAGGVRGGGVYQSLRLG